jgi:hypothetical protein
VPTVSLLRSSRTTNKGFLAGETGFWFWGLGLWSWHEAPRPKTKDRFRLSATPRYVLRRSPFFTTEDTEAHGVSCSQHGKLGGLFQF